MTAWEAFACVVVLCCLLAFCATPTLAADWQLVIQPPGSERYVKRLYYDGGQIACQTDAASEATVLPKGSRIVCEQIPTRGT